MRRSSLAGAYLIQTLDALRDASSSDSLFRELDPFHRDEQILGPVQQSLDAGNRRLGYLRAAVLFAAIAAEAYANEFLAATLPQADAEALDRLSTVDKLLVGPRAAGFEPPLERGAEPIQTLAALFRTRNRLVHPRAGAVSGYVHDLQDEDKAMMGPRVVVGFIKAAAHTAVLLHPLRPDRVFAAPASRVWEERSVLDRLVDQTSDELTWLPERDSEQLPPIMNLMDEQAIRNGEARRREATRNQE